MRITTDRKAALADKGNRSVALHQVTNLHGQYANGLSIDEVEQEIDDLINEWVDELRRDLEQGITS